MDQLAALVGLRWRTELRAFARARERLVGLLLTLPLLALGALFACGFVYVGLRSLDAVHPELTLAIVSLAATGVGLFWTLSPLLAGVAMAETHDVTRLVHFPVPFATLAASSIVANFAQPTVFLKVPVLVAVALGVAHAPGTLPFAFAGVAASFAFILAVSQLVGLVLLAVARNRRLQDATLFFGLALALLISVLPLLLVAAGGGVARAGAWLLASPVVALSPFAWGARAAVHAGRGELVPFAAEMTLAAGAVAAAIGLAAALIARIHRGEVDLGRARGGGGPARIRFSGPLGALLEKDARIAWRDPAIKAGLVMGLLGPLLFAFVLLRSRDTDASAGILLAMASFVGLSGLGSNAFGIERRGLLLLLGFPTPRWRVLLAKNLGALLLRVPTFAMLVLGGLMLAPAFYVVPALAIAVLTFLLAVGLDNYMSILYPAAMPPPGRSPQAGGAAGGRGMGGAFLGMALTIATLAASSPFALLVWYPRLAGSPVLWLVTLPLAAGGAASVYAMLLAGAARLLERREPELLERVLVEE